VLHADDDYQIRQFLVSWYYRLSPVFEVSSTQTVEPPQTVYRTTHTKHLRPKSP